MIRKLLINTGSNIFNFIARIIITFIMTPILVKNLGNYDYGIWELVTIIIGYMGVLDLGIRPAASRFASYYRAKKDQEQLNKIFTCSVTYMLVLSICGMIGLVITGVFWPDLLIKQAAGNDKYTWLFIIIGINVLFVFPGQVMESFLEGYQRYFIKNNINLTRMILGNIFIYYFITPGNALILMAVVNTLGIISRCSAFYYLISHDSKYKVRFNPSLISKEVYNEIFIFSFKTFVQGIAFRFNLSVNTIIIGAISGAQTIVYYVIPLNLTNYGEGFLRSLSLVFLPYFSDLFGKDRQNDLTKSYLVASKYIYVIAVVLSIGVINLGDNFLNLWIGETYANKGHIIIVAASLILLITSINLLSSRYLIATGNHGILAIVDTIKVAIRIPIAAFLVYRYGYAGAIFSQFFIIFFEVPYILSIVCKHLNTTMFNYFRTVILPCIIPGIILYAVLAYLENTIKISNYFLLFGVAITGTMAFCIAYIFTGLNKEELMIVKREIAAFKARP